MFEIKHYITDEGRDVFGDWRSKVKDVKARIAIDRRLYRVELGNLGDHKPCRQGVWELRIDTGPGYRIYYAQAGQTVVLLLCGGTKHAQDADMTKACEYWQNWQRSNAKQEKER
ncbi:type II toxin-antitoxin system RelE/ParE family toxin [Verminephrobacter aporrectodeae subsp. tuberculatae]|uniref:Type II toxin-antitoxin system RelE/ParE family toxin n=1 Tax=Verminephrobacter aporrectodeae subsp. tuberculatae TaxID=1110392 RepID=A0ABT3KT17_9BURK|nr:type II toxin-antitoxin system RelE/ParE family toxin [Verminephrobacter aporrectodeae]MCW5222407.1 type II toxin-antitoxin system RelE/ParE family toxin [Verminephrobacter aporrectodeae subsp. tuberculatae]MCW5257385.1 type II toxin-antitoxin system RelE/ParE family toxin [Verminephrobacter aporrectodeae subsp. tuberculatae]MCW5287871.1 type II toxin-antitoxin system RelE/ParE family toxin [Verminephrobacter aporrectodeae subsp. tuberculatae]MCW5321431.1 type II toxin-antitoxin system RelE/